MERPVRDGDPHYFDLDVTPLRDARGDPVGVAVAFHDRTERAQLRRELDEAREELRRSAADLRSANEELETAHEELQSTNEELETTNEELQSGNEELETMNEELQSTNDELRSLNEQLQVRTDEAWANQAYLEAVLEGLRAGVVVVDREYRILSWLKKMRELWGLAEDEVVGQSLFDLDIGLPVERLRDAIERSLQGEAEVLPIDLDAVNRRGAPIRCAVTCTPLRERGGISGAIVLVQRVDDGPVRGDPRRGAGRE